MARIRYIHVSALDSCLSFSLPTISSSSEWYSNNKQFLGTHCTCAPIVVYRFRPSLFIRASVFFFSAARVRAILQLFRVSVALSPLEDISPRCTHDITTAKKSVESHLHGIRLRRSTTTFSSLIGSFRLVQSRWFDLVSKRGVPIFFISRCYLRFGDTGVNKCRSDDVMSFNYGEVGIKTQHVISIPSRSIVSAILVTVERIASLGNLLSHIRTDLYCFYISWVVG